MTTPTGTISLGTHVSAELGRATNATISMGESAVRTLAGVSSGAISMSALRGKSNIPLVSLPSAITLAATGGGGVIYLYMNWPGKIEVNENGTQSADKYPPHWLRSGTDADYEVMFQKTSQFFPQMPGATIDVYAGPFDQWLAMFPSKGISMVWNNWGNSFNTIELKFNIMIRSKATQTVLASTPTTYSVYTF